MVSNSDVVCHKNTVSIWLFVIISVNFALFISTYIVDVIRYELAESLTLFQRSGAKLNQRWNMVTYESWKIVKAVTFQRENSTLIQRSSVVNAFYIENRRWDKVSVSRFKPQLLFDVAQCLNSVTAWIQQFLKRGNNVSLNSTILQHGNKFTAWIQLFLHLKTTLCTYLEVTCCVKNKWVFYLLVSIAFMLTTWPRMKIHRSSFFF